MTKKIVVGIFAFAALMYFFYKKENAPVVTSAMTPIQISGPVTDLPANKTTPQMSTRKPASVGYVNTPSKDWEGLLTNSLKHQAGDTLKEIKIVKEKSLIWKRDDVPIHVQSVIVTMTNKEDVQSSFKALVDSQTGKVIETWDQSIFDPANVRDGFRFKLDPRYSN